MVHRDLDRLLDFCVRFAQNMLPKNGAFHPFAARVRPNGELTPLAIHVGHEVPSLDTQIARYTALLKNLASSGELDAAALCYQGRLKGGDAIAVDLEHRAGECLAVFLAYHKKLTGGYRYEEPVAVTAARKFFA